jgi:acetolactate synthase regulatory subunit
MQWLVSLETENDMIAVCRLMNIFRRKGLKLQTLAMTAQPDGFALMAVVDSPEVDVDHIFNFLRRTEGVKHVTYYRHEASQNASFLLIEDNPDTTRVARVLEMFPDAKLIFASHGNYLFEVPAESRRQREPFALGEAGFLPFARVKTTQSASDGELLGVAV